MQEILYDELIQYIAENQNRFYRLAFSYTKNQEDALDAVQNAVCKALESYRKIKNAYAIKTWFYRILVNECLNIIKKSSKIVLVADDTQNEPVYYKKGFDEVISGGIEDEIDKLDSDTQCIIKLRYFEDMSLKEISKITGIKENTVKTKLYRGLKQLKEEIKVTVI